MANSPERNNMSEAGVYLGFFKGRCTQKLKFLFYLHLQQASILYNRYVKCSSKACCKAKAVSDIKIVSSA